MKLHIGVTVNGQRLERDAEARTSLADFLREDLDLTGTHVGCEHGVCGACTVLLDDEPVRACLMLAVQANGRRIVTVEGLAPGSGETTDAGPSLHPLQEAFRDKHGLQCGFCTPGILLATAAFLREHPAPSHEEIRVMLAGHLCRCTGYQLIVEAIAEGARRMERRPAAEHG